jgi:hypothetical protein
MLCICMYMYVCMYVYCIMMTMEGSRRLSEASKGVIDICRLTDKYQLTNRSRSVPIGLITCANVKLSDIYHQSRHRSRHRSRFGNPGPPPCTSERIPDPNLIHSS